MGSKTYTLGDDSINDIAINKKVFNDGLHEYTIIHRESFIDELIGWISECRSSDKELMKQDLKDLFSVEDEYIFSSTMTNSYINKTDDNFNQICEELIELTNSLK